MSPACQRVSFVLYAMQPSQGDERRSKRARRGPQVTADAGSSHAPGRRSIANRPTAAEQQEALDVIQQLKAA